MSSEHQKSADLSSNIHFHIENKLESLLQLDAFTHLETTVLTAEKADFTVCQQLAIAAHKLKLRPGEWHVKLTRMQNELVQKFEEEFQYLQAAEVKHQYCLYLAYVGQIDIALEQADHLVDGYAELCAEIPPEIFAENPYYQAYQQSELENRREQLLGLLLVELVKNGQIHKAQQWSEEINILQWGIGYYDAIIHYYVQHGKTKNLLDMLHLFSSSFDYFHEHPEQHQGRQSAFEYLAQLAEKELTKLTGYQDVAETDSQSDGPITDRLTQQVLQVEKLLDHDQTERAGDLAEHIITELNTINPFDPHTSSEFGGLEVFQEFRVRHLAMLAEILAHYSQMGYLIERCIYRGSAHDSTGLLDDLDQVSEGAQPNLFVRIMGIYGAQKDIHMLESTYAEAITRYPQNDRYLTTEYIKQLYEIKPILAWQYLNQVENLSHRASLMCWYIFNLFYDQEPLAQWSDYVNNLVQVESAIEEFQTFPEEDDVSVRRYNSNVSYLLKELAVLALDRRQNMVFTQILNSPLVDAMHKAEIIASAAEMMVDQKKPVYAFAPTPSRR